MVDGVEVDVEFKFFEGHEELVVFVLGFVFFWRLVAVHVEHVVEQVVPEWEGKYS